MDAENIEMYFELANGILGICTFLVTLIVFRFTSKHPELIRSYFFLKSGNVSKPFFYFMFGMLIWGIREFYKVLELSDVIRIDTFYEISEFFSALALFIGMLYFLKITRK